jgi:hypothetical protein
MASGHSFADHAHEFGISTQAQFEGLIKDILDLPTSTKSLRRGRVAYWDMTLAAVVIVDPNSPDCGTAFIPYDGKTYFDNLR